RVLIWPDNDAPGGSYANAVAKQAAAVGALDVKIITLPPHRPDGWDAADALAEGWDEAQTARLISAAQSPDTKAEPQAADHGDDGESRHVPQRDILTTCADDCEFWHDADSEAYVTFPKNGHLEHWKVRSKFFKLFLSGRLLEKTRGAAGSQAIED